jgi:L-ascorbate metabolism protein UlaG (beta-lactamase superfamily)
MSVQLTYYGHSCVGVHGGGARILIDPFLTDNPDAALKAPQAAVDYVLVTHAHGDHLGDAIDIARRTGATVVSNYEIVQYAQKHGCNGHPLHIGGGWDFPFGRIKLTIAHHGSSFPDGSYGGNPAGLLITLEGKKVYHAGDTGLFYDMKLIGEEGVDVALLPIGDNFTMGPADALRAVQLIQPTVVIPIHFHAFDVIRQDPQLFARHVREQTKSECIVLTPGESYTL